MNEDIIILSQLKQGSQLAFTHIYKKYAQQAFTLSFKYLGSSVLAEDAVQDLFMKIWNIREQIDETRPINHLLFRILRNSLLNILRDSKSNCFVIDECLETLNAIDGADAEIQEVTDLQLEIMRKAIAQLSPQRRKIFTMKVTGKYTNEEIADMLHLSVNTIKFQYSQSLKEVRLAARMYAISILIAATAFPSIS